MEDRWHFQVDLNYDGMFTISDLGAWFKYAFFAPGDGLLYILDGSAPGLLRFFEMSTADYGGWFSGIVSGLTWLVVVIISEAVDSG